jgi:pilus assembly protein CpaB
MRRHSLAVMVAGLGLATVLSYLVLPRGAVHPAPQPRPQSPVVIVARHAIAAGSLITPADLRPQLATGGLPAGAISSAGVALGRVSINPVRQGKPLLQSDLRDSADIGIAARVPPGQRAFSIAVMEDQIVGGFLQSGNRVDIFATIPGSVFPQRAVTGIADRSQAVLLLQNIQVLAVGENSATRGAIQSSAHTVSLSVTPEQLARLTLALRYGKISLAVRNPGDTVVTDAASATLTDLLPASQESHATPSLHSRRPQGVPLLLGTKAATAVQDGRS